MMAGDFNAHAIEWDKAMEGEEEGADKRGKMIQSWMEESDMVPLNSGMRTWTSRREGVREMAPDITFVNGQETDKFQWKVLKKLGGSDHHPILITREVDEGMVRGKTFSKQK